ncbi:hypothetical protein [Promineifilum sp.]|uniref:hypothetical protein n=1 Tax=Promineifilum sp. TaxID=2664178 RepID=UPI0035B2FEA9
MNANHERREWAERLEAGRADDELLELAARLKRVGGETQPTPPLAFQQQLRRDLLKQYEASPKRGAGLWRWAGSAAVVGLLALAVVMVWLSVGSAGRPSFGGDAVQPITPQIAATTQIVPPPLPNVAYLEAYGTSYGTNGESNGPFPGGTLRVHVRWRVPAGFTAVRTFAHLRDTAGQTVAQADTPLEGSGETREAQLTLALPFSLPPGDYQVVSGLTDAAGAPQTVYEFDNAALAVEASLGIIVVVAPEQADNASTASEYTYLDYSITGGLVLESVQTDSGDFQTQGMMLPGIEVGVVTRWSLPLATAAVVPFVQLLDGEGRIVAQADGGTLTAAEGAGQTAVAATLSLSLPTDLAPGRYELVGGLYDAVTGARLPISTPQGEVTAVSLDQYEVLGRGSAPEFDVVTPENAPENSPRVTVIPSNSSESSSAGTTVSNFLTVHDVAPAAGTVLSGTAPLHFDIVFSYALDSLSSAFLEVQVVELQKGTTGGRRVGRATAELGARNGSLEVEIIVDPTSTLYGLPGPADLGLRFEIKPEATSDASDAIPLVIETPGDLRWRYEP